MKKLSLFALAAVVAIYLVTPPFIAPLLASVMDDFAGTGALSGNWSTSGVHTLERLSGQVIDASADGSSGFSFAVRTETFAATQSAEITIGGTTNYSAVGVRGSGFGGTPTGYILIVGAGFGGWRLFTIVGSELTNGGSITTGDTFKLDVSGTTLTVYQNGMPSGSPVTDATYGSGTPFIALYDVTPGLRSIDAFVATGEVSATPSPSCGRILLLGVGRC